MSFAIFIYKINIVHHVYEVKNCVFTLLHFQSFQSVLILDIQPRTTDCNMVGNEVARGTSFIRQTAYQRRCTFGILRLPVPHNFHSRLDLLPLVFLFGDFGRWRRKLQLYLAVKGGKF